MFCQACGVPAETSVIIERRPYRGTPSARFSTVAIILIAVLLVAFIVVATTFITLKSVNFNTTYEVAKTPNVDTLILNLNADVANVNLIPADLPNQLIKMEISAKGFTGFFGSDTDPVKVVFTNTTSGRNVIVNSDISRPLALPFSFNLQVNCNLYVDVSVPLNVNAQTSVGKISMNSNVPVVFEKAELRSVTGGVEASLTSNSVLRGNASFSTTTGSVQFFWNNARVTGNVNLSITTTTGSVKADFTQSQMLEGNVSVVAATTTGSANVDVSISGDVGAQLTSHTTTGSIFVDAQHFNGNNLSIYSSNYPAKSNFFVSPQTTTGSVHLTASYKPLEAPTQEEIRDAVMAYIKSNHEETAQFMQNLSWTGGRVIRGSIGAELYTYISGGWNFTITYPVVPDTTYTITTGYKAQEIGIPYRVIWEGSWQNSIILETDYIFAQ